LNNNNHVILLVEDSDDDLMLMRLAFEGAGIRNRIIEARDGRQAIDYLNGVGQYANRERYPLPCLIITDLRMPKVDGLQFLGWLHKRPAFARVPRIMLTSSREDGDHTQAKQVGCCAFFIKPDGFTPLVDLVKHLNDEWISQHCPTPN
jgi:CheY-like chemotaxis protein